MKKKIVKSKPSIKYGDTVLIKSGFFKGNTGIAVDYNEGIGCKFGIEDVDDQYEIKIKAGSFEGASKHWFTIKEIEKVKSVKDIKPLLN